MLKLGKKSKYVYSKMAEDIISQVRNGNLAPGEQVFSEKELCEKYQISRRSVRKGLADLTQQKLLYSLPGKGTFVNERGLSEAGSDFIRTIAFIVPDIEDIFIAKVCKGIQAAIDQSGYHLIIQSSDCRIEKENQNIKYLLKNKVDGAIIFPNYGESNVEAIFNLKRNKLPFVLIDRFFREITTDYVGVNNYQGAFEATQYLAERGHKRICHLRGTLGTANEDRYEGYRDALAAVGIVYDLELVKKMPVGYEDDDERFEPDASWGRNAMAELLQLENPPTAVFAGNDYLALGALQAIRKAGKRVPGDIAMVGFDDLEFASILDVPLTTVRQPKFEIGKKAVEILIKKIDAQKKDEILQPERVVLDTELIVRESSG